MSEELRAFVEEQLGIHLDILKIVKEYIDDLFRLIGISKEDVDKNTYFAMILELTRSIFVNYSVYQRTKRRYKP